MILWTAAALTEETVRWSARWCTAADRAHAARYRAPKSRTQSLLARALLRALLAAATGRTNWIFRADPRGKPFLALPGGVLGPPVSLTHSGSLAAAALALGPERRLGLDIEQIRPRAFAPLAARAFGPRESALVAAGGDAETFYRIWTGREALSKADGAGLRLAADRTDRILSPQNDGLARQGRWNLLLCVLPDTRAGAARGRYRLALAAESPAAWRPGDIREIDVTKGFLNPLSSRRLTSPV